MKLESIYRRPLPDDLIAFASPEGRAIFREALTAGRMEGFFALAEQFHTQADPAFCGLGSLVVTLNALEIDPGRLWKGPWRWFSEDLLDCCKPLERVRETGVSLDELACLARCNGAAARVERGSIERLREDVHRASESVREPLVVVGYDRRALGQTGSGHYSPVGGYHEGRDLVLLLDVARFKYPPHWVPLARLHAAMQSIDQESGEPRGWIVLERRTTASAIYFTFTVRAGVDALVRAFTTELSQELARAEDAPAALTKFVGVVDRLGVTLGNRDTTVAEHASAAENVREALRATEAFRETGSESAAALLLATPETTWDALPANARGSLLEMITRDRGNRVLLPELDLLREQLEAIEGFIARRCAVDAGTNDRRR